MPDEDDHNPEKKQCFDLCFRDIYLVANYPRLVSGLVHPTDLHDFCRVNPLKSLGL